MAGDGFIELSWSNPTRRVDNSVLRDLAVVRVFRTEDVGQGEPRSAVRSRGQIAGYDEIATVRLEAPAPATVDGIRMTLPDRQELQYGRRYTYAVLVEDAQGRLSPPSERVSVVYIVAPAVPEELRAEAGEGEVRLSWRPPSRLVDGSSATGTMSYEVTRTDPDGTGRSITPRPLPDATFTDRGLVNDQSYTYAVRTLRTEGGATARGPFSSPVTATPQDFTAPSPPRDLVAVVAARDVRLSWSASPESDVARYVIYRADALGAPTRIGSTVAPVTTFVDRAVPSGTFRYTVTAQDRSARANESAPSNPVEAVVP